MFADLFACRIYKAKYMDDGGAPKAQEKAKEKEKGPAEVSIPGSAAGKDGSKDAPIGRPRTRSIWNRKKQA